MRISDWSSDVCSSDLEIASGSAVHNLSARGLVGFARKQVADLALHEIRILPLRAAREVAWVEVVVVPRACHGNEVGGAGVLELVIAADDCHVFRSEEHTSELQSLMRISYAVFCLQKKTLMK